MLYNNLSGFLRKKYGKRLGKICIDGGFTCPNRDGKAGFGGCIFCSERGSGEHTLGGEIREQVKKGLTSGRFESYIAYFQNFTNTYAEVSVLRERYDAALIDERIRVLAIGTRPDCIDEQIAALLSSYLNRVDVWVELGLQTASDRTGRIINRGYDTECFEKAVRLLDSYGIPVVAHMIIGLPKEGEKEVFETVRLFNSLPLFGVKIHSLYVARGTSLGETYERGEFEPISLDTYVSLAAESIARLSPSLVIHRVTGDCPKELLLAPEWNKNKNEIIALIRERLVENGWRQGSLFDAR